MKPPTSFVEVKTSWILSTRRRREILKWCREAGGDFRGMFFGAEKGRSTFLFVAFWLNKKKQRPHYIVGFLCKFKKHRDVHQKHGLVDTECAAKFVSSIVLFGVFWECLGVKCNM